MKQKYQKILTVTFIHLSFVVSSLLVNSVHAATFTVNSELDENDINPGNNICETVKGNGVCTLRAALQETNVLTGSDIINLPAGKYNVIQSVSPAFKISDNLELIGAGSGKTIIDAMSKDRGFLIESKTVNTAFKLSLSGLTIKNGLSAKSGGAISALNPSELLLNDIVVFQNKADVWGSGIYIKCNLCSVIINRSVIEANGPLVSTLVPNYGGGLYFTSQDKASTLILRATTIHNNVALEGGGLYLINGTITLINSTVSNNNAIVDTADNSVASGGGIYVFGNTTSLNIVNSTISGNRSDRAGGGIEASNIKKLALYNATISNNTSGSGENSSGPGGGINIYAKAATLGLLSVVGHDFILVNSIIAGNRNSRSADDCVVENVSFKSNGYNIIGNANRCQAKASTGDIFGTQAKIIDAGLDVLANRGGKTQTHALKMSSPAIDAGNPSACLDHTGVVLKMDQRGISGDVAGNRAIDGGSGSVRCDIGAFEYSKNKVSADAGPKQQVLINSLVTLNAAASYASNSISLFSWVELPIPIATVRLSDPLISNPTFTAPAEAVELMFELTITDSTGQQDRSSVEISVVKNLIDGTGASSKQDNNGGGGCSYNRAVDFDPLLLILVLLAGFYLFAAHVYKIPGDE